MGKLEKAVVSVFLAIVLAYLIWLALYSPIGVFNAA